MVVILDHKEIPDFLKNLVEIFDKFNLIFNSKKSSLVNIKQHITKWEKD